MVVVTAARHNVEVYVTNELKMARFNLVLSNPHKKPELS